MAVAVALPLLAACDSLGEGAHRGGPTTPSGERALDLAALRSVERDGLGRLRRRAGWGRIDRTGRRVRADPPACPSESQAANSGKAMVTAMPSRLRRCIASRRLMMPSE